MIEHIALTIAVAYAIFYWWRWSTYYRMWSELSAKVEELSAIEDAP